MNILVDTSSWIAHLSQPDPKLVTLLQEKRVLTHPVIIGELACGSIHKRQVFLGNLKILPRAKSASFEEALELLETRRLYGKGLGFADILILASALLSKAGILTRDRALQAAARSLGM